MDVQHPLWPNSAAADAKSEIWRPNVECAWTPASVNLNMDIVNCFQNHWRRYLRKVFFKLLLIRYERKETTYFNFCGFIVYASKMNFILSSSTLLHWRDTTCPRKHYLKCLEKPFLSLIQKSASLDLSSTVSIFVICRSSDDKNRQCHPGLLNETFSL